MIKRHYILLTFIALTMFTSCRSGFVGYVKHQKSVYENNYQSVSRDKPDSIPFSFRENKILFEAEIDGEKDTVMLDTGCTIALLETVSESQRPDVEFFQVPVNTVNRSKLEMATVPVKYSFANLEIQNARSIFVTKDIPYCDKESGVGDMTIVGTYGVMGIGKRLKLDFTNGWVRIINHSSDIVDLTGYQEVNC